MKQTKQIEIEVEICPFCGKEIERKLNMFLEELIHEGLVAHPDCIRKIIKDAENKKSN